MNKKDLEYLRKMEEEKNTRAFSKQEVKKINESLRTNVGVSDTNEALDLSASIAEAQVENFGTDVDALLDTVLYHGGEKGAKTATMRATEVKFSLATKFIDFGQYDKFEDMDFKYVDKEFFEYCVPFSVIEESIDQTPYIIADNVKTLKGLQYLDKNGKIPNDYFSNDDRHSIENASLEQLEFYVKHGSNINAVIDWWEYGYDATENRSVLDKYIMDNSDDSLEYMKKIIELGGKRGDGELISSYCYWFSYEHEGIPQLFREKINLLDKNNMIHEYDKRSIREAINCETDYLDWKMDALRRKIGDKVGKTADVKTGEITDEHRKMAKDQSEIAKGIIQQKIADRKLARKL